MATSVDNPGTTTAAENDSQHLGEVVADREHGVAAGDLEHSSSGDEAAPATA